MLSRVLILSLFLLCCNTTANEPEVNLPVSPTEADQVDTQNTAMNDEEAVAGTQGPQKPDDDGSVSDATDSDAQTATKLVQFILIVILPSLLLTFGAIMVVIYSDSPAVRFSVVALSMVITIALVVFYFFKYDEKVDSMLSAPPVLSAPANKMFLF